MPVQWCCLGGPETELSVEVLGKLETHESVQDGYRIWELTKMLCRYSQCITHVTAVKLNQGGTNI